MKFLQEILRSSPSQRLQKANTFYVHQDYDKALKLYNKILQKNPQHLAALYNRANIFLFQKKYDEVLVDSNLVIKLAPHLAAGYSLRGRVHLEQENLASAIADLEQAIKLDSQDFWNHNYLSQALQKNGNDKEALDEAFQAVLLSDGADSQHLNLAYTIYEIAFENEQNETINILKKWYDKYGQNPIVEQSYKSFFADDSYSKSNAEYVRKVFDNYADSFEESLSLLEYHSPQQIAALIDKNGVIDSTKKYRILDLGCGTGLCAKALDSQVKKREFIGVDLSAEMLAKASEKKLYHHLQKADIEHYLETSSQLFDGVICADVLTYFGALEPVFEKVASSLQNNGFFAFSISQNTLNDKDWFLSISSRFVHSKKYVEKVLLESGFHLIEIEDSILRKEGEKGVSGWVVLAIKKT